MVGSLTGVVASKRVTEASKGTLKMCIRDRYKQYQEKQKKAPRKKGHGRR